MKALISTYFSSTLTKFRGLIYSCHEFKLSPEVVCQQRSRAPIKRVLFDFRDPNKIVVAKLQLIVRRVARARQLFHSGF
jgi:hypothetical protein